MDSLQPYALPISPTDLYESEALKEKDPSRATESAQLGDRSVNWKQTALVAALGFVLWKYL